MTSLYRASKFLFFVFLVLLLGGCMKNESDNDTDEMELRDCFNKSDLSISTEFEEGGLPRNFINVPKEIVRSHQTSPAKTIKFLCKIVETGKAEDSIKAACFIKALTIGNRLAVSYAYYSPEIWDVPDESTNISPRKSFLEEFNSLRMEKKH